MRGLIRKLLGIEHNLVINQRTLSLQNQVDDLNGAEQILTKNYSDLLKYVAKLEKRVDAIENPKPTKKVSKKK